MAKNQSDFRKLLHRYEQGLCTPAEKRRVEEWYHQLGTTQPMPLHPGEKETLMHAVWQRIGNRVGVSAGHDARPAVPAWQTRVRWAAMLAVVLGMGLLGLRATHTSPLLPWASQPAPGPDAPRSAELASWQAYTNGSAYEARVALPDGSAVTLAPASTLRYPRTFGAGERRVYLSGEAFFDVFHDARHPFLVFTDRVVTRVLGTSFRVQACPDEADVEVQVRTGAVRVSSRTAPAGAAAASLVVRPNQQAVYSGARRQLRRELMAQPVQLAPQSFVFRDQPVAVVLAALEKAYGVEITHDEAALRNCTLTLSLGPEPLFEKLDIICQALGATYEQADGRVVFRSTPCPAE